MRHYGALTCGLSSKWWSEKHNLHHAFTNVIGADEDIIVSTLCVCYYRTSLLVGWLHRDGRFAYYQYHTCSVQPCLCCGSFSTVK